MFTIIAQVFYVLIAAAMIALILMQRGAGADAGSGFGGGASATVFGARGSSNFLSRSTAVLAGMGMFHSRPMVVATSDDLGVMAGVAPKATTDDVPAAPATAPAATDVPTVAPATTTEQPAAEPAKTEATQPEKAGKDGV